MEFEVKIPTSNMPYLNIKLDKLNKRASKLGCPPVYSKDSGVTERIPTGERNIFGEPIYFTVHLVTVYGEAPMLNGWSFIGSIDHDPDGNILRSMPGEEMPVGYRTAENYCDHCKSLRKRVHTYVVRNETGEYKQIGRQCLSDFLGHQSPERIARHAQWLMDLESSIESDEASFNRVDHHEFFFTTEEYVTWVAYFMEIKGWLSNSKARENRQIGKPDTPTSSRALDMVLPPDSEAEAKELRKHKFSPNHKEIAKQALAWCRDELAPTITDKSSEYEYNLTLACKNDDMTVKNSGLVASVIVSWIKTNDLFKKRQKEAKQFADSDYVGKIGERITVTLKILKVITIDSNQFGPTNIHRMQDQAGNVFIWFASSLPLDEDHTYTLKGTIKNHETFRDVKQTILTRCKVIEDKK